jgi:hypothetical protein
VTNTPAPDAAESSPSSAAELLAGSELPATITGVPVTGPKIPPFVGDHTPASDPDVLASIAELLTGSPLPDTITAALMIADPKIPAAVGD